MEALLRKYADVDVRGKDGKTCLHWAIDRNHAGIVKVILGTNPDIEVRSKAVSYRKLTELCEILKHLHENISRPFSED